MIIRSRRKNETLLRRILRATLPSKARNFNGIVSEEAFLYELARETSRSNRRKTNREFAVVILRFNDDDDEDLDELLSELNARLRISDTIGWFDGDIAALLPETSRDGAMLVANDMAKTGLLFDKRFDTEIRVYPWDDELLGDANELKRDGEDNPRGDRKSEISEHEEELENDANLSSCLGSEELVQEIKQSRKIMFAFQPDIPTPRWKRTVDILGSGVGLICLSPVYLLAAIAIKRSSPGPVFFKQRREGKDGRQFYIWKFRTMDLDAEDQQESLRHINEQDGPAFKLADDPRITPIGRYLRKSCVDELPQLVNVLRGEMSLVGPRPLPVHESVACKPWQRHRLRVLPGLTCIWQVDGGRDIAFDDWMRMDMQYLCRRSFFYDLKLIFKTALLAIMHRGSV